MSKKLYGTLALATAMFIGTTQGAFAENIIVKQRDLAVGTLFTIGGTIYKMMQFEVPALGSDKVYLIKFPVAGDPAVASETLDATITVYGSNQSAQGGFLGDTINDGTGGLSGFKAFFDESMYYNASHYRYGTKSNLSNSFNMSNGVGIQLDARTYVSISLASKANSQRLPSTPYNADTTVYLKTTPTVSSKAVRDQFIADNRALYRFVSVKQKN